jgi:hypothetical protein
LDNKNLFLAFLSAFVRTYNAGLIIALLLLFFFLLYFNWDISQNTAFSTNFTMLSAAQHIVPLHAALPGSLVYL